MRIDVQQMIAGFPAIAIRQLMRETLGRQISLRWVKEVLSCSEPTASRVLADLEREGFITTINGHFEPSLKGSALAQATAATPLLRATAERLVSEVVERAKLINADDDWAYRVAKLVLFGSLLGGAERPNDVDIGCALEPRWRGETQRQAEELRRAACDHPFRNICEDVAWPKLEILRFLKSRSHGLSIQELSDWILKQDHKVIFRDCRRE